MKQTVEEAAIEFSDYNGCMPNAPHSIIKQSHQRAFIRGAEWQAKQSPWISVKERLPEYGEEVLVLYEYRGQVVICTTKYFEESNWYYGYSKILAWMPIPTFDQILEANKDVLQRLKDR